jgi:hypothetical protein
MPPVSEKMREAARLSAGIGTVQGYKEPASACMAQAAMVA